MINAEGNEINEELFRKKSQEAFNKILELYYDATEESSRSEKIDDELMTLIAEYGMIQYFYGAHIENCKHIKEAKND